MCFLNYSNEPVVKVIPVNLPSFLAIDGCHTRVALSSVVTAAERSAAETKHVTQKGQLSSTVVGH
jgi:hypothetical protein